MRKACLNALICCAAFLTAVPHFTAASQLRIVIAGEENVFPYSFTEDGRMKGMDYDIVVEACRRMDIQAAVQFLPWNRMVHYVQDGNADAGFGLFYKKERESFALYPEVPLHYSRYSIFVKKGNEFRFESLPDLYGKRVGFIRGYKVNDAFDRGTVLGASLRRTRYPEVTVDRLALGVEQYWGAWRFGYTFNRTDVAGNRVSGHDIAFDRYYRERDSIGLRLTSGSEDALQGTGIVASAVRAAAVQGRHGIAGDWSMQWAAGYVRQGAFYDRRWVQLGLRRAF